jgi:hypothetical protein
MHEPIVKNTILPKKCVQKINVKKIREFETSREFSRIRTLLNSREFSSREFEMHTSIYDQKFP